VLEAVEEIKHWLKSAEWFRDRQIPWTRGWLLYGPPGTGKSSFIRAVGEDCDLPIYVFDLPSMSNEEFLRNWDEMRSNVPCIAAFEDLDAIFRGRDNIVQEQGGGLTFDCFLNAISGIEGAEGVLKIMTTNHVDVLDPALGVPQPNAKGTSISTRPGRVDRAIELSLMDREGRWKIAARILSDCPEYIEQLVDDGDGDSGAQFTDRCIRVALDDFWRKKEGNKCIDFKPLHIPQSTLSGTFSGAIYATSGAVSTDGGYTHSVEK
jgi:SpoVK/Ycf46/Vps4 family AAA+-type ATPase